MPIIQPQPTLMSYLLVPISLAQYIACPSLSLSFSFPPKQCSEVIPSECKEVIAGDVQETIVFIHSLLWKWWGEGGGGGKLGQNLVVLQAYSHAQCLLLGIWTGIGHVEGKHLNNCTIFLDLTDFL